MTPTMELPDSNFVSSLTRTLFAALYRYSMGLTYKSSGNNFAFFASYAIIIISCFDKFLKQQVDFLFRIRFTRILFLCGKLITENKHEITYCYFAVILMNGFSINVQLRRHEYYKEKLVRTYRIRDFPTFEVPN